MSPCNQIFLAVSTCDQVVSLPEPRRPLCDLEAQRLQQTQTIIRQVRWERFQLQLQQEIITELYSVYDRRVSYLAQAMEYYDNVCDLIDEQGLDEFGNYRLPANTAWCDYTAIGTISLRQMREYRDGVLARLERICLMGDVDTYEGNWETRCLLHIDAMIEERRQLRATARRLARRRAAQRLGAPTVLASPPSGGERRVAGRLHQ